MPESFLSFTSSSSFRDSLIARNLAPYQIQGVFTPPSGNIVYEVSPLNDSNVIDSPDVLISTNQLANNLYPLNEWGPDGGFIGKYSVPGAPIPVASNNGPYDPNDTQLDIINEFYIDAAYITNIYGPDGGYKDLVIITDIQISLHYYLPYYDKKPTNFIPSSYTPYSILLSSNPSGDMGLLSQDSYLAKIGALYLKGYFDDRIAQEIYQLTLGSINLDTLQDPFSATMLATGQQPFFTKNWKITVPEFPISAAISFANRLTGTYFPVSFIPGDYFDDPDPINSPQTQNALNVVNNLTLGALGPILNKFRNPSQVFLANTGNGQQSVLFKSIEYNKFRPSYQKNLIQGATAAVSALFGVGTNAGGGYYVGSDMAEPSMITQPANQVAVDSLGVQQNTLVYGPSELGKLYEGNEDKINFGLQAESYSDGGGISGKLVWTSPKYKDNAGFKVGPGGEPKILDSEFNVIQNSYNQSLSTDIEFKQGSILDETQRIINAADSLNGQARLKHVGNAMNQVSKVFNDGYKEMTKGSQVIAYYDSSTGDNTIGDSGIEVGREYCRVFQKDTPYLTYADLQKTDGITTSGRKFTNSVLDNTYNLNIAPIRNPGSTNIGDSKVKKYMFSLENLAWRTSDQSGYRYDDLPTCEKGPNGGRIMWFPPYDITFSEDVRSSWNPTKFLGRPEPIYTYQNTTRSGSINWKIVVDSPSAMNTIIEKQLANRPSKEVDSIMDSFFAGCVKYDIYDLATKFNTIPTSELYTYQQLLNEPRLTDEELNNIIGNISVDISTDTNGGGGGDGGDGAPGIINNTNTTIASDETETIDVNEINTTFTDYAFYFENDCPECGTSQAIVSSQPYNYWYNSYSQLQATYVSRANDVVYVGTEKYENKSVIPKFFSDVIIGNFNSIQNDFLKKVKEVIEKGGKLTIELQGSASAPAEVGYNQNLSKRRIDSVLQWFRAQTVGESTIKDLESQGTIAFVPMPSGETISNVVANGLSFNPVNCTQNISLTSNGATSANGQWYSIPAMACRRVRISKVNVVMPPPPKNPCDDESYRKLNPDFCCSEGYTDVCVDKIIIPPPVKLSGDTIIPPDIPQPIKPVPQKDPIATVKQGISKKILRYLFSECDYFEVIKESNPMVYDSIKEKIKYFSPAFHSTTPEGLNARLTFLNQCMRPGQTIPVIGTDGRPKYNDALNTSFGAPPVLVLRIGDFYHTKIIPNSIGISYDPLLFDINPEGIGVQPMIAKITLSFDFIGGSGLAGPVEQLQNALSFNYYANTEIYDERAVETESTKERDEQIVGKIAPAPSVKTNSVTGAVNNKTTPKGGETIGTLLSTNATDDGKIENGDIEYTSLINELSEGTKNYNSTIYNKLKSICEITNLGVLQIVNFERKYTDGDLSSYTVKTPAFIYGKPANVEQRISDVIKQTVDDVDNNVAPIIEPIKDSPNKWPDAAIRQIRNKLKDIVKSRETLVNQAIIAQMNEMTTYQENYNYTLRKYNVVLDKTDGIKLKSGEIKLYTFTGDTVNGTVLPKMEAGMIQVADYLKLFKAVMDQNYIMNGIANYVPALKDFTIPGSWFKPFGSTEYRRFYITMSEIFLNDNQYNSFVDSLTSLDKVKGDEKLITEIKSVCESYKSACKIEKDSEKKMFTDYEASPEYVKLQSFKIIEFDSKMGYTTNKDAAQNYDDSVKKVKNLYSDININNDNKYTFKVKFN